MNKQTHPVVLVTHETGDREYAMIDYKSGRIYGSIGYNAVKGDIEEAREILYTRGE